MDMIDRIRRPSPVPIRSLWPNEPTDFTPWLAHNLDVLEVLGIGPLSLIEMEKQVPGTSRALDVLAETADGRLVAIENQYQRADHDHLTRALAYAVGLDARAIVVVAEEHPDEFRAVASYLNTCAERLGEHDGIAVFLVEVSVSAVEQFFVPRFEVVQEPNSFITDAAAVKPTHLGSIEEFLTHCPAHVRPHYVRILEDWTGTAFNVGARVSHAAQATIALYRRNPLKIGRQETSVFLLDTSGRLTISRGYLIEGGLGEDEESIAALDQAMDLWFPGYQRTDKNYFPKVQDPAPEAVRGFSKWLAERFDALAEASNPASGRAISE